MEILKDYRVVLNWFDKEIVLIKTNENDNSTINNFGFKPIFKENQIFVGYIYNNSPVTKAGIKLGDRIIKINEKDYSSVDFDCWCEISINSLFKDMRLIKVVVLRDKKQLSFDIQKTEFFK